MRIETNAEMYHKKLSEKESVSDDPEVVISGFVQEKSVTIPPLNYINRMATYFHEAGHVLGDELSFLNRKVLTPDEVKKSKVDFSVKERFSLLKRLYLKEEKTFDTNELNLWNRILDVFTKGNFDSSEMELYCVPQEVFDEEVGLISFSSTFRRGSQGEVVPISSRQGRNRELSSCATTIGCLTILENSLAVSILGKKVLDFEIAYPKMAGSHQRANNVVAKAYESVGWVIPSDLDLEK